MSKHKQRRERRAAYWMALFSELSDEWPIIHRVIRSLNCNGFDIAPDGRPIKADFYAAIKSWEKSDEPSSKACLDLVQRAVRQLQVKPVIYR